ncbi:hypothetical protein CBR_g3397 [Chara braunii]|uniref:Potassium channel tetramerisation-type BTB domain-containing protein n=1 Tax=Chara braunii TaxID=69332 RepID=A0A388JQR7_CHABU|nr:hypothetical protein CBR_g3397 [Chara braunii]|eukprot:GBG60154.1 hypothetical protein CBR_g3397 [Chara braunii]
MMNRRSPETGSAGPTTSDEEGEEEDEQGQEYGGGGKERRRAMEVEVEEELEEEEEEVEGGEGETPVTVYVDCEPRVFQYILSLLRYHSVQALPKMTQKEVFSLKKEADFYAIDLEDTPFSTLAGDFGFSSSPLSNDHDSTSSSSSSSSSSSPSSSSRFADPTLLVTVRDVAEGFCCENCRGRAWGVSFYLRYAFCVQCSSEPRDAGVVGNVLVGALRASSQIQAHHLRMEAYSKDEPVTIAELGLPVFRLDEFAATYEPTMLVTVSVTGCYCKCLAPDPRWCVSLHYRHVVCVSCKKKLDHPRMLAAVFLAAASNAKHTPRIHLESYGAKQQ